MKVGLDFDVMCSLEVFISVFRDVSDILKVGRSLFFVFICGIFVLNFEGGLFGFLNGKIVFFLFIFLDPIVTVVL
jgi:hypothetical protein